MVTRPPSFIQQRCKSILKDMGYSYILFEYTLSRYGRADVYARDDKGCEAIIEIKAIGNNSVHDISLASGQLQFYRFMHPNCRLFIAIPDNTVKVPPVMLDYLESLDIKLLQIELPMLNAEV